VSEENVCTVKKCFHTIGLKKFIVIELIKNAHAIFCLHSYHSPVMNDQSALTHELLIFFELERNAKTILMNTFSEARVIRNSIQH